MMIVALALFWADLIYQLGAQWSLYPQYGYGWAIPFLMGYFLWRRWPKRPAPEKPGSPHWAAFVMIFLAAGFFATRVIQEANLIWRVPSWLMGYEVVGMTLAVFYVFGGTPWLKHFSFPILFFLVAIPWLRPIEVPFIEALAKFNAKAAVEIFSLIGIPVFQQGNVIETSRGLVGIDEACSGMRSFQATLMLSLLFGEYYFLNLPQRGQLVLAGLGLAIVSNILRTSTLVFVCTQQGLKAMENWHDPTGIAILVICFASLWGISRWFVRKSPRVTPAFPHLADWDFPNPMPKFLWVMLLAFFVSAEVFTETWYRAHGRDFGQNSLWRIQFPEDRSAFHEFEISKTTSDRLKFSEGRAVAWNDAEGRKWQMLYFKWKPAHSRYQRIVVQDGKNHVPESCLSSSGKKLISDEGIKLLDAQGLALPFRSYVFDDEGERMHVYFCMWQDYFARLDKTAYDKYLTASPRLAAVALGNRSAGEGLQVLELAVWGIDKDQDALAAAQRELRRWVQSRQTPTF